MKISILKLFLSLPLFLCGAACNNNDEAPPQEDILEFVSGVNSNNELNVSAAEETKSIVVKASQRPEVVGPASWVYANASELIYPSRNSTITFTISPNPDTQNARSAPFTISVGSKNLHLTLIQAKAEISNEDEGKTDEEEKSFAPWINPEPCEISGNTAREVALSLGAGWNLGNQMDAYANGVSSETCWGNRMATQSLFDSLKAHGFSSVRIPVTWLGHIGNAPDYKIEDSWINRVVELVEMAEKAGLNAIVNIHHDGANSKHWLNIKEAALNADTNSEIKAEIKAVWTQIADAMKNKGNFLMFEGFNEIHDGGWGWGENLTDGGKQYKCMNEWNQTFVDAVRSTGGNNASRWLAVPSYVANINLAVDGSMKLPSDPSNKLMVAVHFYDPNDFALNSLVSDWGHTGDPTKKGSAVQDEDYVRSQFAKLTSTWVDKGVPVYVGETGPSNAATDRGNKFRNYYLEYLYRAAREAGLAAFYWDNGAVGKGTDKFGMFDHGDGSVINDSGDAIFSLLRGATCIDPGYSLSWVYGSAAPDL